MIDHSKITMLHEKVHEHTETLSGSVDNVASTIDAAYSINNSVANAAHGFTLFLQTIEKIFPPIALALGIATALLEMGRIALINKESKQLRVGKFTLCLIGIAAAVLAFSAPSLIAVAGIIAAGRYLIRESVSLYEAHHQYQKQKALVHELLAQQNNHHRPEHLFQQTSLLKTLHQTLNETRRSFFYKILVLASAICFLIPGGQVVGAGLLLASIVLSGADYLYQRATKKTENIQTEQNHTVVLPQPAHHEKHTISEAPKPEPKLDSTANVSLLLAGDAPHAAAQLHHAVEKDELTEEETATTNSTSHMTQHFDNAEAVAKNDEEDEEGEGEGEGSGVAEGGGEADGTYGEHEVPRF